MYIDQGVYYFVFFLRVVNVILAGLFILPLLMAVYVVFKHTV